VSTALFTGGSGSSALSTVLGFDSLEHSVLNIKSEQSFLQKESMFEVHVWLCKT